MMDSANTAPANLDSTGRHNKSVHSPPSRHASGLLASAVPNEPLLIESALRNAFEAFEAVIKHFGRLAYFYDAYPDERQQRLEALAGEYSLERLANKLTRLQASAREANIPCGELDERLRAITDIAGPVTHPPRDGMGSDPAVSDEIRIRLNDLIKLRDYYCLSAVLPNPKEVQPIAELSETLKKLERPFAQISDLGKDLAKAAKVDGLTDLGKELADAATLAVPTDMFKDLLDAAEAGRLYGPSMVQERIDQIVAMQNRTARALRDSTETALPANPQVAPPLAANPSIVASVTLPNSLQELISWLAERTSRFNNCLLNPSADLPVEYVQEIESLYGWSKRETEPTQEWAKELQSHCVRWLLTAVHAKLADLGLFGYPNWTLDCECDFRKYSAEASRHLCNLLNFLRSEAGQSSNEKPLANANQSKSGSKRERGRPKDADPNADERIFDAWQTGRFQTYAELARDLGLKEKDVRAAIDRQRKREQSA